MIEVRPYQGDAASFLHAVELPFGWTPRDDDVKALAPLVELDRALAAYDGDRVVGTAGIFSLRVTVPGGELPMAGVTMVGVHPTHRRRGALTEMMRQQLAAIHERGEPLAGLWASEGAIYPRFGYGLAAFGARFQVDRNRAAFRESHRFSGSLRLATADEAAAAFPPMYEAVRGERPGALNRSEAWWRAEFFHDPEHQRSGGSPASYLVHETDGLPTGYARYRLYPEWDERGPKSTLEVHEAVGTSPAATQDVWRYLLDVDLVASIRGRNLPVDHPLLHLVAEPRRLGWALGDTLWLRVVDVAPALERRGWAGNGRLVIEVADEGCPWNRGRWELLVEGGAARVTATTAAPDLSMDVRDLAAAFLGGTAVAHLVRAGRIDELRSGATDTADAMLRVPLAPWCSQMF